MRVGQEQTVGVHKLSHPPLQVSVEAQANLPTPVPKGSMLLSVTHCVNDHAVNEMKRVAEFNRLKQERADELHEGDHISEALWEEVS